MDRPCRRLRRGPRCRRAGEVCAVTTARLSDSHASCTRRHRRPAAHRAHLGDHHPGDPELAARLQRAQYQLQRRSHRSGCDRPDHRAALPANTTNAPGLWWNRLLAARDPDPGPGRQEASGRRRDPILFRRMTAKLIDGKAAALALRERIACEVGRLREATGRAPGLAVVLVGEHPPSAAYVRSKVKATIEAGMESFEHRLPASITEEELIQVIDELNCDPAVDGILVQLPLPDHVDERVIITRISPDKDVDGFHPVNAGRLAIGLHGFVPCTPLGCLILLQQELGDLSGLDAIVVGRSNIVGKPMAQLLLKESCTVTIAHSRTRDLPDVVRRADIVVAAVGRAEMVRGDWLKPGATVIDVGINRLPTDDGKGRLVGGGGFAEAVEVAAAITPVPGGVGPMTIAMLMRNTLVAAHRRAGLEDPEGL